MQSVRVAPIGTCRIHTPLRRAASNYPFELDLTRNYGFVHTSSEVLQQLDLIMCGKPVPQVLWPLIYRPNTTEEFLSRATRPADVYFFEISSAKHVTIDGVPIQINYVSRYFAEFFAQVAVARRFWSMAKEAAVADRIAWLRTVPQYNHLTPDDRDLLESIRMRELTADEIRADMAEIADRVGAEKSVFITHVNALTPDDAPIASRKRLIDVVDRIAGDMKVNCFDPTAHMTAFGQAKAMERDGLDLTHFTLPFADHLGKNLFEKYIKPLGAAIDTAYLDEVKRTHSEVARLRDMLEDGQIIEVSRKLRTSVRAGTAGEDHYRLLGEIAFTLGDYEQAVIILQQLRNTNGANEEDDIRLMNAHLAQGNNEQAISFGRSLLSDERETDEILEACAIAAQNLGLNQEAQVYWRRLVRSGGLGDCAPAALLALLLQTGEHDEAINLADQILQTKPRDANSLKAKWQIGLARRDMASLAALADSSAALDDETALDLVRSTWEAGLATPTAAFLGPRLRQIPPTKAAVELTRQLSELWYAEGHKAFEAGDLGKCADLLNAYCELAPGSKTSIRTRRALEQRFRTDVRNAFAVKDHERVIVLARIAQQHNIIFSELDRVVGRSAAELGKYDVALPYLRKVAEKDPTAVGRLQFARFAAKAEEYDQALAAYNAVANDTEATDVQRTAAVRAVNGMFSGTVRAAREAISGGNADKAWRLLKLLSIYCDKTDRINQEQARIIRQLRIELKALDAGDHSERLELANTLLSLDPTDIGVRRIAAVAAMRTLNFIEAHEHWRTLARQGEMTPQIESALARCELWIARAQNRKSS